MPETKVKGKARSPRDRAFILGASTRSRPDPSHTCGIDASEEQEVRKKRTKKTAGRKTSARKPGKKKQETREGRKGTRSKGRQAQHKQTWEQRAQKEDERRQHSLPGDPTWTKRAKTQRRAGITTTASVCWADAEQLGS